MSDEGSDAEVVAALRRARAALQLDHLGALVLGGDVASEVGGPRADASGAAVSAAAAEGLAELLEAIEVIVNSATTGLAERSNQGGAYAEDLADLHQHLRSAVSSARRLTLRPSS